jgi:amphi-Trp domain-containing protein
MGKETFEIARIASPEEVADVLRALAAGLRRGEVSLESPKRTVRLTPAADLKLELTVKDQDSKGKIVLEIGWKRRAVAKAADLRVEIGHRTPPSP